MNLQNLQQENGTLLMTKIMDNMVKGEKMIQPLSLKQKSLNQVFVTIQMHIFLLQEIELMQEVMQILKLNLKIVLLLNDEHVEAAEKLDIIAPMYNFLEYSDNYADSPGSLWQFKRDELNVATNPDVTTDNSTSFKYKSNLFQNPTAAGVLNGVRLAVSLKYLSSFFRSLEVPLIN